MGGKSQLCRVYGAAEVHYSDQRDVTLHVTPQIGVPGVGVEVLCKSDQFRISLKRVQIPTALPGG